MHKIVLEIVPCESSWPETDSSNFKLNLKGSRYNSDMQNNQRRAVSPTDMQRSKDVLNGRKNRIRDQPISVLWRSNPHSLGPRRCETRDLIGLFAEFWYLISTELSWWFTLDFVHNIFSALTLAVSYLEWCTTELKGKFKGLPMKSTTPINIVFVQACLDDSSIFWYSTMKGSAC